MNKAVASDPVSFEFISIIKKILRSIWTFFCWTLLLAFVVAAVGGIHTLYQLNNYVRQHVLDEFKRHYPGLSISIRSVELVESKGISIKQIECSSPGLPGAPQHPVLAIGELFLECPITIQAFLKQEINIGKIIVRNPIARLTRRSDGSFEEVQYFQSRVESTQKPCPIEIFGGTFLYRDAAFPNKETMKFSDGNFQIAPPEAETESALPFGWKEGTSPPQNSWKFSGSVKGDFFRLFTVEGEFNSETKFWRTDGKCRQLDWSSEMLAFLPISKPIGGNPDYQKSLESFQGRFDLAFSAVKDSTAPLGFRFVVDGILSQGRAELVEIGRTLSELNAKFRLTDEEILLEKLSGIGEAARLVLSYRQEGLLKPRTGCLTASLKGLAFDKEFVKALSPFLNESTKHLLSRFAYRGVTDLDVELLRENGRWKPQRLDLNLADLAFTFLEFPYDVERLTGRFQIDSAAKLGFDLQTRGGESPKIRVIGTYENVFDDPYGKVQIWGEDVPINSKLMLTIPETHRAVVESLHPIGKINAFLDIQLPPGDDPIKKHFEIGLNHVSISYDKFPYPVREICGSLLLDDETWTFQNIDGTNESASIKCVGHLKPIQLPGFPNKTFEFLMQIRAEELPLDGQLPEALVDLNQRELLAGLRVKGKVDLDARVLFRSPENKLDLQFAVVPRPGVSMSPIRFPYRIDNVQGRFFYNNGIVAIKQLSGNNRDTKIKAGVFCQFSPGGDWLMRLDPLIIDQIPPNRELQDALPTNLQSVFEQLQIQKSFNLNGKAEFSKQGAVGPLLSVWDVNVVLHQNSINFGIPIQNIFGDVHLTGLSVDSDFRLAGEMRLDSVTIRDCQATDVVGPFFYEGKTNQFFLGQQGMKTLPPPPEIPLLREFRSSPWFAGNPPARPIMGKLFEGTLFCEGLVLTGNSPSYSVNVDLIGANLAKIAQELEPGTKQVAGILNFKSHVQGAGRKYETMGGSGSIRLRNANIYELPGMMRLLQELSITDPNKNSGAFSSADVDFRIQGNKIILDPIIFEGSAFSLKGNGEMRLDNRNVNVIMKTRLGNRRNQIPILSDIVGGAGDQFIQLSVQGPLGDPTVSRVALPEIRNAIRQIQGEETTDYGGFGQPTPTEQRSNPLKLFPWR